MPVSNMIKPSVFVLGSILTLSVLCWTASANPQYKFYQCKRTSDCKQGECCTIGMMRYSTPTCQPMGQDGDSCRPGAEPQNMTLYYPNGVQLDLEEIHTLFCPCQEQMGLSCVQGSCHSSEFVMDLNSNNIL